MAKPIQLTPNAEADLTAISEYILTSFGRLALNHFYELYESKLALIASYPTRYPILQKKNKIRKSVITKQSVILYIDTPEEIRVISVFDTRQNPENIGKQL